jgi:ABC-type uncharacterized transport system permease subunit
VIWRTIGGAIAGIIAAFVIVQVAEFVVHQLYPPPSGYNMRNMEEMKRYVSTLPAFAMVIVLVGQLAGTIVGTFAAARIGRSRIPAYVLGALLLIGGIASAFVIPQPLWFLVVEYAAYICGTIFGAMSGSARHVQTQSS